MTLAVALAVLIAVFVGWRYFFFFRNPDRSVPRDPDVILSPADGFVVYIKKVVTDSKEPLFAIKKKRRIRLTDLMHLNDQDLAGKQGYLIGVFMTPFDVHYNRAPIEGYIQKVAHEFPRGSGPGAQNRNMFNALSNLLFNEKPYEHDCDYVVENERASFVIRNEQTTVYLSQIAEKWIRRIVTYRNEEHIQQGEVFGLVRMGSQVDLFVPDPDAYEVLVTERQRVKAGLTALLRRKPGGAPGL